MLERAQLCVLFHCLQKIILLALQIFHREASLGKIEAGATGAKMTSTNPQLSGRAGQNAFQVSDHFSPQTCFRH